MNYYIPSDNDKFYIEHDKKANKFSVKEDADQSIKKDIVTLVKVIFSPCVHRFFKSNFFT